MKSFLKIVSLVALFAVTSAPLFSTAAVTSAAVTSTAFSQCIEIAGGCL